jgi:hypothetical protein
MGMGKRVCRERKEMEEHVFVTCYLVDIAYTPLFPMTILFYGNNSEGPGRVGDLLEITQLKSTGENIQHLL